MLTETTAQPDAQDLILLVSAARNEDRPSAYCHRNADRAGRRDQWNQRRWMLAARYIDSQPYGEPVRIDYASAAEFLRDEDIR